MRRLYFALLCSSLIAMSGQLSAADPVDPPVLSDLKPEATLPASGAFDLAGIRLGMTYEEAVAKLESITKKKPTLDVTNMTLNDNRGNIFPFKYERSALGDFSPSAGVTEYYNIVFTTRVNGRRVAAVERRIEYNQYSGAQEASIPDLRSAVASKYGAPSFQHPALGDMHIWFKGNNVAGPAQLTSNVIQGTPMVCAFNASAGAAMYNYAPDRGPAKAGCNVTLTVYALKGTRDDLASSVRFTIFDWVRVRQNQQDTDAWLNTEFDKVVNSKKGVVPKL